VGLSRRSALALVLVGLGLASCGRAGATAPVTTKSADQGPLVLAQGGTVTVAVSRLPTNFNPSAPAGANAVTTEVMAQVWPQPFVVNPSGNVILAGGGGGLLAQAETTGVSPETVVYTINPAARWSDGVPITAEDFIYNWREHLAMGAQLPPGDLLRGYQDIESVTGSNGGRTVTVVFKTPFADWEGLFANLIPAHIARRFGWSRAFQGFDPRRVISGGPFEVARVVPGRELVLDRNPRYFGPKPRLDRIIFRVVHGERATLAALRSGRVDVAEVPSGPAVTRLLETSSDLVGSAALAPTLWQLVFNVANPVLGSVDVRQAIAKAIDRHELVANTIGLDTTFGTTSGNRITLAGAPGSQGNDSAYASAYLAEAAALLAKVGYAQDADGYVMTPSHRRLVLDLTVPSGSRVMASVAAEIQAQLLQVGIVVRIRDVPEAALLATILPAGSYELALAPYTLSPYPSAMARLYTAPVGASPAASSSAPGAASPAASTGTVGEPDAVATGSVTADVLGYDNPAVDALFNEAAGELNATAAAGLYNEIDTQLWADMPTLPLFQVPMTLVTRVDVVNVSTTQTWAGPLWNADQWAIQLNPPPTVPTTAPSSSG